MTMPRALRPFTTRGYRILAIALTANVFAGGVWTVAAVLTVRRLGGGPGEFSVVAGGFATGMLIAVLLGGAVADRVRQKSILVVVAFVKSAVVAFGVLLGLASGLEVWHLAVIAVILGIGDAFSFPAYSALLPAILPADDLLAANGFEGLLRPAVMQAAGPAVAAALIAAYEPTVALAVVAGAHLVAGLVTLTLVSPEIEAAEPTRNPVAALLREIGGGLRYVVTTRWLVSTLILVSILLFAFMGPFEVLLPFAIFGQTEALVPAWGVEGNLAIALAAFGMGGAVGSVVVASLPLPRRYLTVTTLLWGIGCIPLVLIGTTNQILVIAAVVFMVGAAFSGGAVIWGTLLQRRVAPEYYGRVSSLDWFVSLLFMPVSMAVAGLVGERVGFAPVFLIAGTVPLVTAVAVVLLARFPADEIRHPLDVAAVDAVPVDQA
jgi:MFS family permease